jgi:hypothetical protein
MLMLLSLSRTAGPIGRRGFCESRALLHACKTLLTQAFLQLQGLRLPFLYEALAMRRALPHILDRVGAGEVAWVRHSLCFRCWCF